MEKDADNPAFRRLPTTLLAAATRHDTYPAPHDYFTTTRRILQAGVKCHFVTENCQEVTKVSVEREELPAIRLAREMHCQINQPENGMFSPRNHKPAMDQLAQHPELLAEKESVSRMYRVIGPQADGYAEAARALNAKLKAAGIPSVLFMAEQ